MSAVMNVTRPPAVPAPALRSGTVELMPGDVAAGWAGVQFKTLLGSCVSVILTDPRRTVGAMCHIVHVGEPSSTSKQQGVAATAYGISALAEMERLLLTLAVQANRCHAYVYGGGNMFPALAFGDTHVGARNAAWVQQALQGRGITIVDASLGGHGYRKVSWTVGSNEPVVQNVFPEPGIGYDR